MKDNNYKPVWNHNKETPVVTRKQIEEVLSTVKLPYNKRLECGIWEVFDGKSLVWMADGLFKKYQEILKACIE